jgi:hypothetical protein
MKTNNPDTAAARILAAQTLSELQSKWADVFALPEPAAAKAPNPRPADYDDTNFEQVCAYGDIPALEKLMIEEPDLLEGDDLGIVAAAGNGQIEMLQFLLDHGVDIHANGDHPLQMAANNGYIETVRFLLDKGADIHVGDDCALTWAADEEQYDVMTLLLEKGALFESLSDKYQQAYTDYMAQGLASRAAVQDIPVEAVQTLSNIFTAATWAGHSRDMIDLWSQVPQLLQDRFDFQHALVDANILAMKQRKPKITLTK